MLTVRSAEGYLSYTTENEPLDDVLSELTQACGQILLDAASSNDIPPQNLLAIFLQVLTEYIEDGDNCTRS